MRSSIITLQSQLDQAKERLKDVEETIKKSTGRIFTQNTTNRQVFKRSARHFDETEGGGLGGGVPVKKRSSDVKGRLGDWVTDDRPSQVVDRSRQGFGSQRSVIPVQGRIVTRPFSQGSARDSKPEESMRIPARKRLDSGVGSNQSTVTVFSRLSGPPKEDDVEKVKISSQVLVQEQPSRKEILAAQSKDKSCKERNRRMFGSLLGTLQKFRQEESKLKEKEDKKAQVEKKVEEAAEREKEEAMKQRRELFSNRRHEQINIRHLEFKLTKLKQLSDWEANKNKLLPFIQTEAQPRIFFLPKKHNAKTKKLLEAHQQSIQKAIEKKKAEIEKLIEDHIPPPMDENREEDFDTMDIGENQDESMNQDEEEEDNATSLLPSAVIKQERKSSSSESDSDTDRDDRQRNRSSSRSSDSDSSEHDNKTVKIKTENERRTSDKENLIQSNDIKIKIEAT